MDIFLFIFLTLLSVYLFFMYRYGKKKEDQGIEIMPPTKADIPVIIFCIIGAIVSFLFMIGVLPR